MSSAGRRAVVLHGLPALTYKIKKACGQRHSAGAGGGDYTAAGRLPLVDWWSFGIAVSLLLA